LAIDGNTVEYFTSPISQLDVAKYGFAVGDNAGHQVWEALAIFFAVDRWSQHWKQQRIIFKVRSDNVTALVLLIKMRPKSAEDGASKLAIVGKELALRLVDLSFPPDAEHTLGMSHVCCRLALQSSGTGSEQKPRWHPTTGCAPSHGDSDPS
jgi:hypothetical protein